MNQDVAVFLEWVQATGTVLLLGIGLMLWHLLGCIRDLTAEAGAAKRQIAEHRRALQRAGLLLLLVAFLGLGGCDLCREIGGAAQAAGEGAATGGIPGALIALGGWIAGRIIEAGGKKAVRIRRQIKEADHGQEQP